MKIMLVFLSIIFSALLPFAQSDQTNYNIVLFAKILKDPSSTYPEGSVGKCYQSNCSNTCDSFCKQQVIGCSDRQKEDPVGARKCFRTLTSMLIPVEAIETCLNGCEVSTKGSDIDMKKLVLALRAKRKDLFPDDSVDECYVTRCLKIGTQCEFIDVCRNSLDCSVQNTPLKERSRCWTSCKSETMEVLTSCVRSCDLKIRQEISNTVVEMSKKEYKYEIQRKLKETYDRYKNSGSVVNHLYEIDEAIAAFVNDPSNNADWSDFYDEYPDLRDHSGDYIPHSATLQFLEEK
jgi:hypothetical protein